jgi:large subunit ribosomal protein L18
MTSNIHILGFRRKRNNLTDYRKRLKTLSSRKPRLVIRRSLRNIQASLTVYSKEGDIVKVSSHTQSLKKFGWTFNTGNLPSAYLTGFLLGKKALISKLDGAILDIGFHKSVKGSKIYAVVAGALDAGLDVSCGKEILPSKERISGNHIFKYAEILKKDEPKLKKQFGTYLKNNIAIEDLPKKFEEVKANIEKQIK